LAITDEDAGTTIKKLMRFNIRMAKLYNQHMMRDIKLGYDG
jgi:hypothetical protein